MPKDDPGNLVLDWRVDSKLTADEIEKHLTAVLMSCKLCFDFDGEEQVDRALVARTWKCREVPHFKVVLYDDAELPARWVDISGGTDQQNICVRSALSRHLEPLQPEALVLEAQRPDHSRGALARAALGRTMASGQRLVDLMRRYVANGGADRMEAALVATMIESKDILPDLRSALTDEGDNEIRSALEFAVQELS